MGPSAAVAAIAAVAGEEGNAIKVLGVTEAALEADITLAVPDELFDGSFAMGVVGRLGQEDKLPRGSFKPAVESRMLNGVSLSISAASPSLFESANNHRLRFLAATAAAVVSASLVASLGSGAGGADMAWLSESDCVAGVCDWPGLPGTDAPALAEATGGFATCWYTYRAQRVSAEFDVTRR